MQLEVVLVSSLALLTSSLCGDAQDNDVCDMQSVIMIVLIKVFEVSGIFIRSLRWFLLVFTSILTALMSFVCWLACAPATKKGPQLRAFFTGAYVHFSSNITYTLDNRLHPFNVG